MTIRGRIFLAAGAVISLVGMALGLHDLTKVGVLLISLPLVAGLLTRRPVTIETSRRLTPERVPIDGHSDVTLTVRHTGRYPTPLLRGEERLSYTLGDRPHLIIPRMDRGESRQQTYRIRSHIRGHHPIGPLTMRVADPFGLATRSMTIPGESSLIVLPRVIALASAHGAPAGGGVESRHRARISLHGEDDVGVREYRVGDDLRRVHWRSTARTGETMVRQDEEPTRRRALVILDDRDVAHSGSGIGGSFEWSITAVASVTHRLISDRYEVHLCFASDPAGARAPLESVDQALDQLAAAQPHARAKSRAIIEALDDFAQHGGGLVIAVLGPLDKDSADMCAARTSHGLALIVSPNLTTVTAREDPASETAQRLSMGGWRAQPVRAGDQLPALWEQLTLSTVTRR